MAAPAASTAAVFDRLTMGMVRSLEQRAAVVEVRLRVPSHSTAAASDQALAAWQRTQLPPGCTLPADVAAFYRSSDGLRLAWSVLLQGEVVPLGRLHLAPLAELRPLPAQLPPAAAAVADLRRSARDASASGVSSTSASVSVVQSRHGLERDTSGEHTTLRADDGVSAATAATAVQHDATTAPSTTSDATSTPEQPQAVWPQDVPTHDGTPCPAFVLDECLGDGTVVLVLRGKARGEVWFRDHALAWHLLAGSFTEYYRLMTLHLGLPGWQYALTPVGPSRATCEWFNVFAPLRLAIDRNLASTSHAASTAMRHTSGSLERDMRPSEIRTSQTSEARPRPATASGALREESPVASRLNLGKVLRHVNSVTAAGKRSGEEDSGSAGSGSGASHTLAPRPPRASTATTRSLSTKRS